MKSLQQMRHRVNLISEKIRQEAIEASIQKFKDLCENYWRTGDGAGEINELYHKLEELGANMEYIDKLDDEIYQNRYKNGGNIV